MANYFVCLADQLPCPDQSQVLVTEIGVEDFAAIGITPGSVGTAFTFGVGLIFAVAVIGLVAGWIVRTIRTL